MRHLVAGVVLLLAASTVSAETLRVKVMSVDGHLLDGTNVEGLGVTLMRSPDRRVNASNGTDEYTDAMLTRISSRPSSAAARATSAAHDSPRVRSACTTTARRPAARTSAAVVSASSLDRL